MGFVATEESEKLEMEELKRMVVACSGGVQRRKEDEEFKGTRNVPKEIDGDDEEKLVCVTSGVSFLGLALVNRLLLRGYSVRIIIDHQEDGEELREQTRRTGNNNVSIVMAKLTQVEEMVAAFEGCRGVFHTAAFTDPAGLSGYSKTMAEIEVKVTENVMKACARAASVRNCVLTSSLLACVWRDGSLQDLSPVINHNSWSDESVCINKKLWYALGKLKSEKIAWKIAEEKGLLQDRLNRFAGNLKQAAESDARIERSVRDHSALMSILDCRPIESALPTLARPIMSLDATEDAIVGALKQSLRQLETLGAQRAGLEDMLKEMKRKDDILPKLMTSTGSYEDLFRKEISKYDHICEEIAQNIEAQEQLLMQIQAQNEEFSAIFNLEDYKASREKCYKQIQAAIAKYLEIKENINEGLKFYVTLQDAITNIKQQCSDFVMTRNIQCREMIEDVQRQMAGLSFQDRKTSGSYDGNYPTVGQPHQTQRTSSPQQTDPQNAPHPHPQTPYYRAPEQPTMPGYGHPPPPYGNPQPSHPYHPAPAPGAPYPPPQAQQQPPPSHEYGQPAYPGWRGPYYNAQGQQPGSFPRPPYTAPAPYTYPNQSGYYKQ